MKFVLLVICCLLAVPSQSQKFKEEELRPVLKHFLETVWELGKTARDKSLTDAEVEKEVSKYLLDRPIDAEKVGQDLYEFRRKQSVEFAKWLIEVSSKAEDYALKPFLGIRAATKDDSEFYKDCLIWKISLTGKGSATTFTWIFAFGDSATADINDTGQRIPKIIAIGRVSIKAPLPAGFLLI